MSRSRGTFLQLGAICIVAATGLFARSSLGSLQESIRASLRLTDNQISLLQGPALALPLVLGAVPVGLAIDRHSRTRVLQLATLLAFAATFLASYSPDFALLFLTRCIVGLTAMATSVASYSMIADLYEPAHRGRATMIVVLAQVVGSSIAFAAGGQLLVQLGASANAWRSTLAWMSAGFVPALLALTTLVEPKRLSGEQVRQPLSAIWSDFGEYRILIVGLITGATLVNVADGAALVWTAPTLSRNFGLPADQVGSTLAAILLASGIVGPFVGGPIADYCQRSGGPRRTLTALGGLAALSGAAGAYAALPDVILADLALALFLTLGIAINIIVTALTVVALPHDLRALCMAMAAGAGALFGLGIAPLLVSATATGMAVSIGTALAVVCAGSGAAGTIMFFVARHSVAGVAPARTTKQGAAPTA